MMMLSHAILLSLLLVQYSHCFSTMPVPRLVVGSLHAEPQRRKKRRIQRKVPIESPMESTASIPIQDIRTFAAGSKDATVVPSATTERSTQQTNRPTFDTEPNEDPLAQLLKDAENLRDDSISTEHEPSGVKGTIRNVLSTIVTIDFFVVCGLLLWFIAGIVSSVFFKDDDIQLGFNGIFESVVQPALGILMIAAISDAILKGKEEEEV